MEKKTGEEKGEDGMVCYLMMDDDFRELNEHKRGWNRDISFSWVFGVLGYCLSIYLKKTPYVSNCL